MNDLLGTKKGKILTTLLEGSKMMTQLKSVISSYDVLRYNILELQTLGYIIKHEDRQNNRKFVLSLTDKGRAVAEKLQEAQDVAEGKPSEEEMLDLPLTDEEVEKAKHISLLYHVNVSDDHVTVQELIPGKPSRIFNIYIKRNGGGNFRLWCEHDNSYDCWHVKTAWTYPQVQQMMMHYRGKTRICISCNYENPEEAQYCMHCGARLE